MRILLSASLLLLLAGGCAAQPPPGDDVEVQKSVWWLIPALVVGATIYSTETAKATAKAQQKKAIKAQKEMQQEQIEAEFELAGERAELTERQMELQMGQRQIELLADLYLEQDRTEPRILTLPASREPPGIVDRINLWIDESLRA